MTINEYYNIIISKYNSSDYKIRVSKTIDESLAIDKDIIDAKEFPLHALNYLIFEYMKDNKDNRWKLLLDYILVPNGMNQKDCDIDFTKVNFEEFFYFMLSIKN
jgi:hypothetical protein